MKKKIAIYDCAGMGVCPSDYICLLDHYPGPDEKTNAQSFSHQGGGPVATALCVPGMWGASVAMIGVTGDDDDGRFVVREFEKYGVDTRFIRALPRARTACAFIWVDVTTGRRTCVLDRTGMPFLRAKDITSAALPPAKFFHTDGRDTEACIKAMKLYKKAGTQVIIDAGSVRPRMDELIASTDHFIASHNFARQFFGPNPNAKTVCTRILEMGPSVAIVTLGEKGCVGATKDGGTFEIAGHSRAGYIVDTNGAGDVFHGAYIYGLIQGWDVERCAKLANAAAFLKCGSPGGRLGIPPLKKALSLAK